MSCQKKIALGCLLGLLIAPSAAWSAKLSRGDCINAVKEKYGSGAFDVRQAELRAGVRRCLKYGPGAI
jgi:hypothetical protein